MFVLLIMIVSGRFMFKHVYEWSKGRLKGPFKELTDGYEGLYFWAPIEPFPLEALFGVKLINDFHKVVTVDDGDDEGVEKTFWAFKEYVHDIHESMTEYRVWNHNTRGYSTIKDDESTPEEYEFSFSFWAFNEPDVFLHKLKIRTPSGGDGWVMTPSEFDPKIPSYAVKLKKDERYLIFSTSDIGIRLVASPDKFDSMPDDVLKFTKVTELLQKKLKLQSYETLTQEMGTKALQLFRAVKLNLQDGDVIANKSFTAAASYISRMTNKRAINEAYAS